LPGASSGDASSPKGGSGALGAFFTPSGKPLIQLATRASPALFRDGAPQPPAATALNNGFFITLMQ
jgi:hypothetical protein